MKSCARIVARLRPERNDEVFFLSSGQVTGFDVAVETQGQTLKMTEPIEDLVFQEK